MKDEIIPELENDKLNAIFDEINLHTIPLYKVVNETEPITPIPLGTGVLVGNDDFQCILSAGHVFTNEDFSKIGTFVSHNKFHVLNGELEYIQTEKIENTEDSYLDIAVYCIDKMSRNELKTYFTPLPLRSIQNYHSFSANENLFILGYPSTYTTINTQTRTMITNSFRYITYLEHGTNLYKRVKANPDYNYLVEYRKMKLKFHNSGKRAIGPNPAGMSGCGLWAMENDELKLIGIMNGYNLTNAVMIATKIKHFNENMLKAYLTVVL